MASVLIIDLVWKQSILCKDSSFFIISISELNSKINIFCENVNTFILFTKGKVFKSASWNHLGNHLNYYSSLLSKLLALIIVAYILIPALVRFPSLVELTQFSHLIFFFQYNLVCFDFVQPSNCQKSWFDIVWWPDCFVRGSLMAISVLCNTLYTGSIHLLQ